MEREQFWRKSYDAGLKDVDPSKWEISYVDVIKTSISKNIRKKQHSLILVLR